MQNEYTDTPMSGFSLIQGQGLFLDSVRPIRVEAPTMSYVSAVEFRVHHNREILLPERCAVSAPTLTLVP